VNPRPAVPAFSLDLRVLALWRIALGAVVLLDILLRARDLQAFYGDAGMLSRALYFQQSWEWTGYHLFLASGSTTGLLALFALWALAAFSLMVGYHTRLAALLTWYFVVSIQLRNPMVLDGGDDFLRLLLFWTPFLPLGARWSLDARRHPEWARLPNAYRSLATFGVTLQFFVFYLFAALLKTGPDWSSGNALYYTLSIDQFVTGLGKAMLDYPDLLPPLTRAALMLEYLLPAMLLLGGWFPLARTAFYLLAVGFHLAIAAMLDFGLFMPIVLAGLTIFFPTSWLERLLASRSPGSTGAAWKAEGSAEELPESLPAGYRLAWWTRGFCAFMMGMIVTFNVYSLEHEHRIPPWTVTIANLTFEQQHWHFFAPNPFKDDGWYELEVTGEDGQVKDVWSPPGRGAAQFRNQRWRRWMQNLTQIEIPDNQSWRHSTLIYLAARWRLQNPQVRVKSFRLVRMVEMTPPPGQTASVTRQILAELQLSASPPAIPEPPQSSGSSESPAESRP
jgi:hypothetical protein